MLLLTALTAEPTEKPRLQTPAEAVLSMLADLQTVPTERHYLQRYVWVQDGSERAAKLLSYCVNLAASRTANLVPGRVAAEGHLVRWDLGELAPRPADLKQLVENWERLATDEPCFHVTVRQKFTVPAYRATDGRTYSYVKRRVAAPAGWAAPTQAVIASGLTRSNASIVEWRWLMQRMLTTVDIGLGGKGDYYRFAGVAEKQSDFLTALGADEKVIERLQSDQRAALFRSGVTGKPRRIDLFHGQGVRGGQGLIAITHDPKDADIDATQHAIRNLLVVKDAAREVIAERGNGLHVFALFDAAGKRADEVPPDVAADHLIPAPHTRRLQPAIGCVRCHGPVDGWQTAQNDVLKLVEAGLDVFGDSSSKGTLRESVDRLAGLYTGNLDKPIARGRNDYDEAIFRVTGGLSAKEATAGIAEEFNGYVHDMVSTKDACQELGRHVGEEQDAISVFKSLVPKRKNGVIVDPIVGALLAGLSVSRQDFNQILPDLYLQMLEAQEVPK